MRQPSSAVKVPRSRLRSLLGLFGSFKFGDIDITPRTGPPSRGTVGQTREGRAVFLITKYCRANIFLGTLVKFSGNFQISWYNNIEYVEAVLDHPHWTDMVILAVGVVNFR
jgi:hypothetical protein